MDYWLKASSADAYAEEEAEAEKVTRATNLRSEFDTIELAVRPTTALRWIMQAENMENEHDAGYIVIV